jgi:hypothetical protein
VVDLEDCTACQLGDAIGTAIEADAQDDDLLGTAAQRRLELVIDQARPRHSRRIRTRRAEIENARYHTANYGQARNP